MKRSQEAIQVLVAIVVRIAEMLKLDRLSVSRDQTGFLKTEISLSAYDDVIKDTNAQDLRRLNELILRLQVTLAGLKITRRMVMGKDDGRGSIDNHVGVYITRMN